LFGKNDRSEFYRFMGFSEQLTRRRLLSDSAGLESNKIAVLATVDVQKVPGFSAAEQEVVALFDELRERLLRYLLSFSLSIPDAEDILQETFLALFEHLRGGKCRRHLRGWLFRVAHNLALRHRRSRRNPESGQQSGGRCDELLICPAPNPEEQLATGQAEQRLMSVLQALPEQNRWCLYLRAEGLRYREIAEILDISLGSVSAYLERSLAHISRAMKR
jgi:RNA polymerase sigma-70 factor, ECF subfamily